MEGGFFNRLMERGKQPTPKVGMGVTIPLYSDREVGTIVEILSPKLIVVQNDKAIRTDELGMSDAQSYRYERDTTAPKTVYRLRKNGRWVVDGQSMKGGQVACLGYRAAYYDYSF